MKPSKPIRIQTAIALLAVGLSYSFARASADETSALKPNQITEAEKKDGWRLLFDGTTATGWRGFKKPAFPEKGWVVEDGWIKKLANVPGGDVITLDQFSDFELQWEWRLQPGANSGVKYFITEERASAIGHEYQMLDDLGKPNTKSSTASFYHVLPPKENKPLKPAWETNHSRIIVQGNLVEHWLNGEKVVTFEMGSPEVLAAVAKSKFKDVKGFGTKSKGHILLTDHRSETWFRSIKIRVLPAK